MRMCIKKGGICRNINNNNAISDTSQLTDLSKGKLATIAIGGKI